MMALSSLTLALREGTVEALEHHERIFLTLKPILDRDKDLTSDGILFTHFFLLHYQVSAAQRTIRSPASFAREW